MPTCHHDPDNHWLISSFARLVGWRNFCSASSVQNEDNPEPEKMPEAKSKPAAVKAKPGKANKKPCAKRVLRKPAGAPSKKVLTEAEKKRKRETSAAWHDRFVKKGVEREEVPGRLRLKCPNLQQLRQNFIKAWIENSDMAKNSARNKAANDAWMASTERAQAIGGVAHGQVCPPGP